MFRKTKHSVSWEKIASNAQERMALQLLNNDTPLFGHLQMGFPGYFNTSLRLFHGVRCSPWSDVCRQLARQLSPCPFHRDDTFFLFISRWPPLLAYPQGPRARVFSKQSPSAESSQYFWTNNISSVVGC